MSACRERGTEPSRSLSSCTTAAPAERLAVASRGTAASLLSVTVAIWEAGCIVDSSLHHGSFLGSPLNASKYIELHLMGQEPQQGSYFGLLLGLIMVP